MEYLINDETTAANPLGGTHSAKIDYLIDDKPPITSKTFLFLMALGLLIKLALMPVGCHIDMLSNVWVPYKIAYTDEKFHLADPIAKEHILPQLTVVPYYKLIKPFLYPALKETWGNDYQFTFDNAAWLKYSKNNYVFRINFLTKLPFLFFDLLALFFFMKLFSSIRSKQIAGLMWMLNPLSFYVVYLFGRFETYAAFFIILSFYFAKKEKNCLSCISIGIAAAFRYYPVILFPAYIIFFSKTIRDYLKYSVLCLIPILLSNLIWLIPFITDPNYSLSFKTTSFGKVTSDEHGDFLLSFKINQTYIFILFYLIFLLKFYYDKNKKFSALIFNLFIIHLIFYAFVKSEPQYFFWCSYYVIFFFIYDGVKKHLPILLISLLVYFAYLLVWGGDANTLLFMPIAPDLIYGLPGSRKIIRMFANFDVFRDLIKTAISAIAIFYAVYIINVKKKYEQ
ncbi:MAG TPA: hypothetical protein PKY81_05185 [bacterium]|nr:hypothetical protein [bacterium]HPN30331.1 hypothetical protein [bacterium]